MYQKLKVILLRISYLILNWYAWRGVSPPPVVTSNLTIETAATDIALRLYTPGSADAHRVIVYFHGGGWVLGDLETHRPFCEQLCDKTRSIVIAVDYRLAPENPFPTAVDDCRAATEWILENSLEVNKNARPVFVAGDSAGGNLAAVTARNVPGLAGQALIYPVVQHYSHELPSYTENAKGYKLTRKLMIWFWDTYLKNSVAQGQTSHPLATPLEWEKLSGLPPALVFTAQFDPLRDEGMQFADRLADAGIPCYHSLFEGALHGFLCSEGLSVQHLDGMRELKRWLDHPLG